MLLPSFIFLNGEENSELSFSSFCWRSCLGWTWSTSFWSSSIGTCIEIRFNFKLHFSLLLVDLFLIIVFTTIVFFIFFLFFIVFNIVLVLIIVYLFLLILVNFLIHLFFINSFWFLLLWFLFNHDLFIHFFLLSLSIGSFMLKYFVTSCFQWTLVFICKSFRLFLFLWCFIL